MAKVKVEQKSEGLGCLSVLLIVFLVLKLTDNIDWSWWWVLSPLWIGLAIWGVVAFIVLIVIGISKL